MNASQIVVDEMLKRQDQPAPAYKALMAITDFGVSGRALAQHLGCSVQSICYWKNGKHPIGEQWEPQLWALLGECVASKEQTIAILKSKGAWDREMRAAVNRKFARAAKVYDARLQQYQDVA